jgi:hemerythrin
MKKTSELIWQDKQHQVLFELIDQLESRNFDRSIFGRLYDYAEHHFSMEEFYMKELEYPGIEEHIIAHNRFRSELDDMLQMQHTHDEAFRQVLAEFLRNWLTGHIFGIDKDLEEFVLKSNRK